MLRERTPKFLGITVSLVVFFYTKQLLAEETIRVLSWDETVKWALQKNPDLGAAQRFLEARSAQYKGSINGILPRVDLTNSYARSKTDTALSKRWQARGAASLDLFNQARTADIAAAHSRVDQAKANLQLVSSNVLFNLRQAFITLLYTQQMIEVSKTILGIRKDNTNMVSLRYDSGRESKGNRLRAQAERLEAEADLNQSYRDKQAAQQELSRQLGEDSFLVLEASETRATDEAPSQKPSFEPILENHPDVALKRAELESADVGVRQAQSAFWPSLSASYARSFQSRTYFPDESHWTASGVLSLPLFGSGLTSSYYAVSEAKRNQERSQENLRSIRNQVRSDLESAWSNFSGAAEQRSVQQAFLQAARQRNQEADIRYSNGLMNYDDWERIVTERINFEKSVIGAERDVARSKAQWDKSCGKGLGD